MRELTLTDVSLLALLAHSRTTRHASAQRIGRLVPHIRGARAREIANVILGKRTRSKSAKKAARAILRWASKV